jgi:hypothetical protein
MTFTTLPALALAWHISVLHYEFPERLVYVVFRMFWQPNTRVVVKSL